MYSTVKAKEFLAQTLRYEDYFTNKSSYLAPNFKLGAIKDDFNRHNGGNVGINSKGTRCVLRKKF